MNEKRLTIAASLAFCLCLLGTGCAGKNSKAEMQGELQKLYSEQADAMNKKDVNGTLAHYAPDYVTINAKNKTHDLAAEKRDMATAFAAPISDMHFASTIHDVTLNDANGKEATVSLTRSATGTVGAAGRTGAIAMDAEIRDFWVKGSAGWQLKREKIVSLKPTLNGKPMGR